MRKQALIKILKTASSLVEERNEDWCSIGPAIITSIESGGPVGSAKINQAIESLNQKMKDGPSKKEIDDMVKNLSSMSPEDLKSIEEVISSETNQMIKQESFDFNKSLFKVAELYGGSNFARDVTSAWLEYSEKNIIKISSFKNKNFHHQLDSFKRFADDERFGSYLVRRKFIVKEAIISNPSEVFSETFSDIKNVVKRPFPAFIRFLHIIGLIMDIYSIIVEVNNLIIASKEVFNNYKDILAGESTDSISENLAETFKSLFDSEHLIEKAKKFKNQPDKILRLVDFTKLISKIRASIIRVIGSYLNALTFFIDIGSMFGGPVGAVIGVLLDISVSIGIYSAQESAVVSFAAEGPSTALNKIKKMSKEQIRINCEDVSESLEVKNKKVSVQDLPKEVDDIFFNNGPTTPSPSIEESENQNDYLILKEKVRK